MCMYMYQQNKDKEKKHSLMNRSRPRVKRGFIILLKSKAGVHWSASTGAELTGSENSFDLSKS